MIKTPAFRILIPSLIGAITLFVVACGGGGDDAPTATTQPTTAPTATTPAAPSGDAASGEALFTSNGCSACHSTGSDTVVGPGLGGVKDRAASQGGDSYLTESIKSPAAVLVEGFGPLMPTFPQLTDQNVADLVAYLNTLD